MPSDTLGASVSEDAPSRSLDALHTAWLEGDESAIREVSAFLIRGLTPEQCQVIVDRVTKCAKESE